MKRTNYQNKRIYTLLEELGLKDSKEDIVFSCSNGRTSASSEMTKDEADDMIIELNNIKYENQHRQIAKRYGLTLKEYQSGAKMRGKICSYAWMLSDDLTKLTRKDKYGKKKVDYSELDKFLKGNRMKVKKPLDAQNYRELQSTVTQIKQIKNYYRK